MHSLVGLVSLLDFVAIGMSRLLFRSLKRLLKKWPLDAPMTGSAHRHYQALRRATAPDTPHRWPRLVPIHKASHPGETSRSEHGLATTRHTAPFPVEQQDHSRNGSRT